MEFIMKREYDRVGKFNVSTFKGNIKNIEDEIETRLTNEFGRKSWFIIDKKFSIFNPSNPDCIRCEVTFRVINWYKLLRDIMRTILKTTQGREDEVTIEVYNSAIVIKDKDNRVIKCMEDKNTDYTIELTKNHKVELRSILKVLGYKDLIIK